jgi:GDP-L-fucose synthase
MELLQEHIEHRLKNYTRCISKSTDNYLKYLMETYNESGLVNIGVGEDISIIDLACLIRKVVGFEGEILFDKTKPDGTPRKLMDTNKLNHLGWKPSIKLDEGIHKTIKEVIGMF